MNRARLVATLLALALAAPLGAQSHPSYERGFDPEKVYQFGDIDNINLLNGNLAITLRLGQKYPVGGGLTYGFNLIYNSKVWDHQEAFYQGRPYTQALPDRMSNAGMGWVLSFGSLLGPSDPLNDSRSSWTYVGPDGADHPFFLGLHDPGPIGVDPCTAVCYTRDGSYIRMTKLSASQRAIELPDGTRHLFTLLGLAGGKSEWRITEIRDRHEDGLRDVEITYPDRLTTDLVWEIRDKHNRLHTVTFENDAAGRYKRRVKFVDLAAFAAGSPPARYTFAYLPPQAVRVPCSSTLPFWNNVSVPLLSSLFLPDGSSYGMMYYHPIDGGDCRARAMLSDLFLPTAGKLHYAYQLHRLPIRGCSTRAHLSFSAGIATRQFLGASGENLGTWTYSSTLSQPPPLPSPNWLCDDGRFFSPPSEQIKVEVVTPLKDKSAHYFSVYPGAEFPLTSSFDPLDYGLSFGRIPPRDASGTRFLSTEVFDCDQTTGACPAAPVRSTYVRFERDSNVRCGIDFGAECFQSNRRQVTQRVVYNDGKFADSDSADFDGFGHYRSTTATGNFTADDARTTFTNYNPGNVLPGSAWVLGTYTEQWTREKNVKAKTQHCFDANTGFLKRKRLYSQLAAEPAPLPNDVVVVYTVDPGSGNSAREESYGGDKTPQALSTSTNLCGLPLPTAGNDYRIDHTYQFGSLASSVYVDAAGIALPYKTIDQTIDQKTGLVAAERDSAGVRTDFTYDSMARLRTAKPQWVPAAGWHDYAYTRAQGGLPARVDIRQCSGADQVNCSPLTHHQVEYDALGRMTKERQLQFDGTFNKRLTRYDAMGQKSQVSELQSDATPDGSLKFTTYAGYDPFGRPGTVTPPDGAGHAVTFSYAGVSSTGRNVAVAAGNPDAAGNVPEVSVWVTEFYDRHGRLMRVREPSSPTSANVTTDYTYTVQNQIGSARTTAPEATQNRFFNYDGRGFLTSETHPEKVGQVRYSRYDSRGHVGQKEDGASVVVYSYDRGERLGEVRRDNFSGPRIKRFVYATPADSCGLCNGKLRQAQRTTFQTIGTTPFEVTIEETYTYGARGGLVSRRDTRTIINGGQFESFTQSFDYNHRGALVSLGYPQCTHAACTSGAAAPRSVLFNYWYGFLTQVNGFTGTAPGQLAGTGITYQPTGAVRDVQHGNGVLDTYAIDTTNWMKRPASIATSGALQNWSSGAYRYDGAGNIKKVGTDWFQYDQVGRLRKGVVHTDSNGAGGTASERAQSYVYDSYGNIQSITTQVAASTTMARGTPTSAATNRLTGAVSYDNAGNLIGANGVAYTYDPFNQITRQQSSSQDWLFFYTADDERIWAYNLSANASRWTLRDLDHRVLREYSNNSGVWSVANDYVYRDGLLLAAVKPGQPAVHFSLDHLGSPRLVTDANRQRLAYHVYYPFGEEATTWNQDVERMKFTGHERDFNNLFGPDDDLDYMHARFCSLTTARFLSVDPAGNDPGKPQAWNRYAYVQGNPVLYTDPTGKVLGFGFQAAEWLDSKIEQAEAVLFSLTPGGASGVYYDTQIGVTADVARGFTDLLRVGHASGEALGSGAGPLETTLAIGGDGLRVAAIAAPLAGAGRSIAARTVAREAGAVDASAFVGRRTSPGGQGAHSPQLRNAPFQPVRNTPGTVGGRQFSGHALDQMQNRGLTPTVIENTIKVGQRFPGKTQGTVRIFDAENSVTVVMNARGSVITVW